MHITCSVILVFLFGQAPDALLDKQTITNAWSNYINKVRTHKSDITINGLTTNNIKKSTFRKTSVHLVHSKNESIIFTDIIYPASPMLVKCNSKNCFYEMTKEPNGWLVKTLERPSQPRSDAADIDIAKATCQGLYLANKWLPDIVADDNFTITKMSVVDDDILVLFKFSNGSDKPSNRTIWQGEIALSMKLHHNVKRFMYTVTDMNGIVVSMVKGGNAFFNDEDVGCLLKKREYTISNEHAQDKFSNTFLVECQYASNAIVNNSIFRMSTYGLPDPPWEVEDKSVVKAIPWYVYIGIGGIGCLLIAIWMTSRRKDAI